MSSASQETAFYDAVLAAEAVRQSAVAVAQAKYNFVKSAYAQFQIDLVSAQTTYFTAIIAAATANGINPNVGASGPIPVARSGSKIGGH
jgi:hypothetical protein